MWYIKGVFFVLRRRKWGDGEMICKVVWEDMREGICDWYEKCRNIDINKSKE